MDGEPRLLMWAYTPEEQEALNTLLAGIGAPPARAIEKNQGMVTLREIIHEGKTDPEELNSLEKVLLFYNVPQKGVMFLIDFFRQHPLPRPIYAVVTEHSMEWPFHKLLEHLIEERDSVEREREAKSAPPNPSRRVEP